MSGLLVKSTLIMKENLELMNERGIKVPVVLGGAALTRRYVEDDLKSLYHGQLFYARDAFAGLHTMDHLVGEAGEADGRKAKDVPTAEIADDPEDLIGEEAKLGMRKPARPRAKAGDTTHTVRSDTGPAVSIPSAPFFGSRVVDDIPLDDVFAFINETALFKGQWQFKQGKLPPEEYQTLVRD